MGSGLVAHRDPAMPTVFSSGDMFAFPGLDAFAHGCPCGGAMEKGISIEFRVRHPRMYAEYKARCRDGRFAVGDVFVWTDGANTVFNLGTQRTVRAKATMGAIERTVAEMIRVAEEKAISKIGLPRIGSSLGRLPWPDVRAHLLAAGARTNVELLVFESYEEEADMANRGIYAFEHMRELEANPEWVAARDREDEELARAEAELSLIEAPMVRDLKRVGLQVESVWDLVNTRGSYPEAMPALLSHLRRPYPIEIREGIARALAVPETRDLAWRRIKKLFIDETDQRMKEAYAVALAAAAIDEQAIDEVVALLRDRRHGPTRILFLSVLDRWTDESRARGVLMALGTDPDLQFEVQVVLRKMLKREQRRQKRKR